MNFNKTKRKKMLGIVFELLLSYVQFTSTILVPPPLTASGGIGDVGDTLKREDMIPAEWRDPMYYLSFVNLNIGIVGSFVASLNDPRVHFMALCIALPLGMILFGLLFLNSKKVVVWYFLSLGFFLTLCVGASGRALLSTVAMRVSANVADILIFVGAGGLAACGVLFLLGILGKLGKLTNDEDEDAKTVQAERMAKATQDFNIRTTLEHFFFIAVSTALGLVFVGVIPLPRVVDDITNQVPTQHFSLGIGVGLFVFAGIWLPFFFLSLFRRGREAAWKLNELVTRTLLNGLLLSLSFLYIPIGAATLTIFNCRTVTCPPGFRVPDVGTTVSLLHNASAALYSNQCVPCTTDPNIATTCPATIRTSICGGMSAERVETDLSVSCEGVRNFFWPAGALVLLFYSVGVPLLFFLEIRTSSNMLKDEFPIKEPRAADRENPSEYEQRRWEIKVASSNNSARFLFEAFEFKFRYMRLLQLIQKLIVVFTTVFVIRYNDFSPRFIALGISLAVHATVAGVFALSRPFMFNVHDLVGAVLQTGLCFVIIVALLVASSISVPSAALSATMAVSFCLPAAVAVSSVIYFCVVRQREKERREKETEMELQRVASEAQQEAEEARAASNLEASTRGYGDRGGGAANDLAFASSSVTIIAHDEDDDYNYNKNNNNFINHSASFNHQPAERSVRSFSPTEAFTSTRSPRAGSAHASPASPSPSPHAPILRSQPSFSGSVRNPLFATTNNMASSTASFSRGGTANGQQQQQFHHLLPHSVTRRKAERERRLIREKARRRLQMESGALQERQRDTDARINHRMQRQLRVFLMASGVIATIAMGLSVLGLWAASDSAVGGSLVADSNVATAPEAAAPMSTRRQLAGYANWADFTAQCCCAETTSGRGGVVAGRQWDPYAVEIWVCANGATQERVRSYIRPSNAALGEDGETTIIDGFSIRPMCSNTFANGCDVDTDGSAVSLVCPQPVSDESKILW